MTYTYRRYSPDSALGHAMASEVALFLGAGASACFGKQTAIGFLNNLSGDVHNAVPVADRTRLNLPPNWVFDIRQSLAKLANTEAIDASSLWRSHSDVDLEEVLDYLTDLPRFATSASALPDSLQLSISESTLTRLSEVANALIRAIHTVVRRHYSDVASRGDAKGAPILVQDVHLTLLNQLYEHFENAPVFTTNYDLAVEQAFSMGDWHLMDGSWNGQANTREWSIRNYDSPADGRTTCLFKLHGSCNWYYENPD